MKNLLSLIVIAVAIAPAFADDCKKSAKGGKDACCMKMAKKATANSMKGCCNAPGEMAKFKVFAGGKYSFYGCADMAEQGRISLMEKFLDVSAVQPVQGKVRI